MRIITVNLPINMIKVIKALTGEGGLYPSRSELIRVAIREFLISELEAAKSFSKFQQQTQFSAVYPPEKKEEKKEIKEIVKIPWEKNSQGEIIEYKEYKIIQRCELNV